MYPPSPDGEIPTDPVMSKANFESVGQHILLEAFGEGAPGPVSYHPDNVPESTPGYEDLRLYTDLSISVDEAIAILEAKYGSPKQATQGGGKRGHKRRRHRRR